MTTTHTALMPAVVTPEVDWPAVGEAIAGFLAGYGDATRDAYSLDLRQWLRWCTNEGKDLTDVLRHLERTPWRQPCLVGTPVNGLDDDRRPRDRRLESRECYVVRADHLIDEGKRDGLVVGDESDEGAVLEDRPQVVLVVKTSDES